MKILDAFFFLKHPLASSMLTFALQWGSTPASEHTKKNPGYSSNAWMISSQTNQSCLEKEGLSAYCHLLLHIMNWNLLFLMHEALSLGNKIVTDMSLRLKVNQIFNFVSVWKDNHSIVFCRWNRQWCFRDASVSTQQFNPSINSHHVSGILTVYFRCSSTVRYACKSRWQVTISLCSLILVYYNKCIKQNSEYSNLLLLLILL